MKRYQMTPAASTFLTTLRRFAGLLTLLALLITAAGCSADEMVGGNEGGGSKADNTPPTVSITSPLSNAELKGEATLQASAADDQELAKVEFYADGKLIGTSTSSPWSFTWNTIPPGDGPVTLQAKAFDAANNEGVSAAVPVSIKNGLVLKFTNSLPTSISINPSGQSARTVASGKSTSFRYDSNPGEVSYSASAKGTYGLRLRWNKSVSTKGTAESSVSMAIQSGYFYLTGKNSSSRTTSSLYVNYKRSNEIEVKPFSLGSSTKGIGYFRGSGATHIRIYAKFKFGDLSPVYWDFAQDISGKRASFTLGNTAAAKQPAEGNETNLSVHFEPAEVLPQPEGTVHYSDHAEPIVD